MGYCASKYHKNLSTNLEVLPYYVRDAQTNVDLKTKGAEKLYDKITEDKNENTCMH